VCDLGFCDHGGVTSVASIIRFDWGKMQASLAGGDVDAYRFCAIITMKKVIPVAVVFSLGLTFACIMLISFGLIVSPLISLLWKVVVYDHIERQ